MSSQVVFVKVLGGGGHPVRLLQLQSVHGHKRKERPHPYSLLLASPLPLIPLLPFPSLSPPLLATSGPFPLPSPHSAPPLRLLPRQARLSLPQLPLPPSLPSPSPRVLPLPPLIIFLSSPLAFSRFLSLELSTFLPGLVLCLFPPHSVPLRRCYKSLPIRYQMTTTTPPPP